MRAVPVVWDDRFLDYAFPPGHPFQERSRWLAVRLLEALYPPAGSRPAPFTRVRSVPPAPTAELERFHRPDYLEFVRRLDRAGGGVPLDGGDTPSFAGCTDAAARIVGGTLAAFQAARAEPGTAFAPAGGLHHARPDGASGFCIFNDLAVAIARELATNRSRRVAYVDIDAHHGDGVMYGFYDDGRVLDLDFHQDGRTLFPGTGFAAETGRGDGVGAKVNVALPPGTGDTGFTRLFTRIVPPLLRAAKPDLLVLQCGVDGHAGDRLGETALEYTARSYRTAVATLVGVAEELGGRPVVVTGGGGYSAEHVARILAQVAGWLAGENGGPEPPLPEGWRTEFTTWTEAPAPVDWSAEAHEAPWSPEREASIVAELESALGRRFPAGDGAP